MPDVTDLDLQLTALGPKVEMTPGLFGMRLPLPFALDHVNIWLLRDDAGWTLIDTGMADDATKDFWTGFLENDLEDRPVRRLIATHFHPDHMGLASWLCEQSGAEFWTTRTEWLTARALSYDRSDAFIENGRRFDHRAGLDADLIASRAKHGNIYSSRAMAPPAFYQRLREGDDLVIDGEAWRVLIGRYG